MDFQTLGDSEEAQICMLQNLFELWRNHNQMMVVLVDKLLKTQVVECSAVATWVFSKEMTSEFTKMYLWEILHLTIKKMNKHVVKLGSELTEAKEKLARVESSSSESEEEGNPKRKKSDTADRPTEEMVEKLEEKLEAANVDQKRLFLIVFQRFIMILSEHLVRCDTDGRDFDTDWYKWTVGRLQQVFLMVSPFAFLSVSFKAWNKCLTIFFSLAASRTSPEVQQHFGNSTLYIRPRLAHS